MRTSSSNIFFTVNKMSGNAPTIQEPLTRQITIMSLDANKPLGYSIKQKEQLSFYCRDTAGNNVAVPIEYIATMKHTLKLDLKDEVEFEEYIKKHRSPSPCPCKSIECVEEWKKDMIQYQTLLTARTNGETIGNVVATGPLDKWRGRGSTI